jgi:hypothetical protein
MPKAEVNAGPMRRGDITADAFARAANSRKVPLLFINFTALTTATYARFAPWFTGEPA